MEDIKVAKHQLEVCFRSNLGFKEEVPRVLRIIKQNSESYIQFFFKTITEVLTSSQVHTTPSIKFYALLTLMKASEAKNYSFYHFLVKESDLLNYIYYCAGYDLNPKSGSLNKGTHYFSKYPSSTEIILGFNVVRLCQEIIVNWNHLCKEFKPIKYFEIFKFLLGRVRKTTQLEKPFYFINKCFDLRQDIATCNFQTKSPYIISRQNSRSVLKVPNQAAQGTKSDNEESQADSDSSVDMSMSMEDEFAESAVELIFTRAISHNKPSSQDNRRGSVLDQLRRENLQSEDENLNIQKSSSSQGVEKPESVGGEGVELKTEQGEQLPEASAFQTATEEIYPTLVRPSKVVSIKTGRYSRYNSGDATVALSQQEDNIEEQKEEDIEQGKKIDFQKQLLVRTQPATPDKLSTFFYLARGNSGGSKVFGGVTSKDIESDLMKIKDNITKSQTISRKTSISDTQANTPQRKSSLFDFEPNKVQAELEIQPQINLVRLQGKQHVELKRVQSLHQGTTGQSVALINTIKTDYKRPSDRRATWHFGSSTPGRETGLGPQVSNMLVHSKGGLTKSIQRGIRTPQIGGKANTIIVFADQEEKENNDNTAQAYMQENQLLKEKLKEYEQMIKMLEDKVENLTIETKQLKKATI